MRNSKVIASPHLLDRAMLLGSQARSTLVEEVDPLQSSTRDTASECLTASMIGVVIIQGTSSQGEMKNHSTTTAKMTSPHLRSNLIINKHNPQAIMREDNPLSQS